MEADAHEEQGGHHPVHSSDHPVVNNLDPSQFSLLSKKVSSTPKHDLYPDIVSKYRNWLPKQSEYFPNIVQSEEESEFSKGQYGSR